MNGSKLSYGIAAALGCAFALFVLFVVLQPTEHFEVTAYAEFQRDLAAGKIEEIHIDGTTYRYRVMGAPAQKKTTGPKATLASIVAMHGGADSPPPKVYCEP